MSDVIKGGRYGDNIEEVAARTMALFYLFDTSGSMSGTKIGQVNYAMKDIPQIIMDVADGAPNANIVVPQHRLTAAYSGSPRSPRLPKSSSTRGTICLPAV